MANEPIKTRVFQGIPSEQHLKEIGLTLEGLITVVSQGEFARVQATDHDPVTAGAYDAYRYRVRGLRDIYRPHGWGVGRENGLEMIVSQCGRRAIITRAGDDGVGDPGMHPQPKRAVGETTARAVGNNASLWLDPNWGNTGGIKCSGRETWMLLVFRKRDLVRAELSLPSGVSEDGEVLGWLERIILPEHDFSQDPIKQRTTDSGSEVIDVPVKRRK